MRAIIQEKRRESRIAMARSPVSCKLLTHRYTSECEVQCERNQWARRKYTSASGNSNIALHIWSISIRLEFSFSISNLKFFPSHVECAKSIAIQFEMRVSLFLFPITTLNLIASLLIEKNLCSPSPTD